MFENPTEMYRMLKLWGALSFLLESEIPITGNLYHGYPDFIISKMSYS